MIINTLARRGNKAALAVMDAYNPDQERDENGRWVSVQVSSVKKGDVVKLPERFGNHEARVTFTKKSRRYSGFHEIQIEPALKTGSSKVDLQWNEVVHKVQAKDAYNPDQGRDEKGMWTSGGGGARTAEEHFQSAKAHAAMSEFLHEKGDHQRAQLHTQAAEAHQRASRGVKSSFEAGGTRSAREQAFKDSETARGLTQSLRSSSSSARTMTELPAIKETPLAKLAMSQRVPAGNQKDPRFGSDPNRVTQKEMPAVGSRGSKQSRQEAAASAAGEWASRALTAREAPRGRPTGARELSSLARTTHQGRTSTPGERDAKERLRASVTRQLGGGPYGKMNK